MKSIFQMCLFVLVFSSCTIQKRLYTKGYHVSFTKRHRSISLEDNTILNVNKIQELDSVDLVSTEKKENESKEQIGKVETKSNEKPLIQEMFHHQTSKQSTKLHTVKHEKKEIKGFITPSFSKQKETKDYKQSNRSEDLKDTIVSILEIIVLTGILVLCFVYPTFGVIFLLCLLILLIFFILSCLFSIIDGLFDFFENW